MKALEKYVEDIVAAGRTALEGEDVAGWGPGEIAALMRNGSGFGEAVDEVALDARTMDLESLVSFFYENPDIIDSQRANLSEIVRLYVREESYARLHEVAEEVSLGNSNAFRFPS